MDSTETIASMYAQACDDWNSSICEHLPTLKDMAKSCAAIASCETGGETGVDWALLQGLVESGAPADAKILYAPMRDIAILTKSVFDAAQGVGTEMTKLANDNTELSQDVDLVFIDTCNVQARAQRLLDLHHARAKKHIVLFTIAKNESFGMTMMSMMDIIKASMHSGYSVEEILQGLGTCVEDFVAAHPEWSVKETYSGLIVLEKGAGGAIPPSNPPTGGAEPPSNPPTVEEPVAPAEPPAEPVA